MLRANTQENQPHTSGVDHPTAGSPNLSHNPNLATSKRAPKPRSPRLEEDRLNELLNIAAEVFIAQGFESASTNEIARRANASKTTFYSRFPTKEVLFEKVIEHRMSEVFGQISPPFSRTAPIGQTLREFAMNVIRASLSPLQVSLIRMMSMESKRFPDLGRRFYDLGAGRGKALLAEYLTEQIRGGALTTDDPHIMAEHLISLVIGGPVHWFVLGFSPTLPSGEQRIQHVDRAVTAFLRAYGNPASPLPEHTREP